jgi:hypothetical protein
MKLPREISDQVEDLAKSLASHSMAAEIQITKDTSKGACAKGACAKGACAKGACAKGATDDDDESYDESTPDVDDDSDLKGKLQELLDNWDSEHPYHTDLSKVLEG